ncbi:short chain dehydrogenase/reductase, putative [Aspergillus fumigatus A1163]|uniref:Short chain dehydrogenase/reductase, putative n=1 Tax=Aspergillus fumigatus (strain CBS 144.89 / FGSC A1163 / CEA10) TaxID=451804 RepID=B0XMX8_ASPFC|nr:short chain dehydrogenase/reductase, putative [Aspergillus fumigatus A1163]
MHDITLDPLLLGNLTGKTAVLTGGAGGIGTAIAKLLLEHGANVVVADLEHTRPIVETMIVDLPGSCKGRVQFVATNISAKERFGSIELVIANAEVMERTPVLDMDQIDEHGNLEESHEFCKVIDINVKGTMNCLRHAIFSMKGNQPCYPDGSRGAVVLVSSISGYFGGTGVSGYITSKHAVTGMLRGSQLVASQYDIRVNAVAPFVTPTAMAGGFSEAWQAKGLPINTTEGVATVVLTLAVNPAEKGSCYIVWRSIWHRDNGALLDP